MSREVVKVKISGSQGVGKTTLARALAWLCEQAGVPCKVKDGDEKQDLDAYADSAELVRVVAGLKSRIEIEVVQ